VVEQLMDVLREILMPRLEGIRKTGSGFDVRCPAHDDRKASLSIATGKEQPVVLHCQAGCDPEVILDKIGLKWEDLCRPHEDGYKPAEVGEWTPCGPAVDVYDYVDESGTLLFQVCRTFGKDFPQRRPDSSRKSGWNWKLGDTRRVLYRLPHVIEAVNEGKEIYVVEGERDVRSLERIGVVATCNPGGAGSGKFRPEFAEVLREARVTIVADKDNPGQVHAREISALLKGVAGPVRIVEAAEGKDITDHLNAGRDLAELVVTWTSDEPVKVDLAPDLWEFIGEADAPYDWVLPGLLERGDRLIWTGFEGLGKSMALRQIAVCAAAGLDPFRGTDIPKINVLFIDCENSERLSKRKFRPLAAASVTTRHRVPDGALRIIHRPEGIDLTRDDDAAWLFERVTAHKPDLLIIGPFYRLHAANLNEELPARRAVGVLDAARVKADCALIVEAHAGHGEQGKNRSVRPAGSSLLLRWPEFGLGIAPAGTEDDRTVNVLRWRGARDGRDWPERLTWGGEGKWPWQVALTNAQQNGSHEWTPTSVLDKMAK
jgi:5S rRNA maturation endonuclease (ribonuclease M5)